MKKVLALLLAALMIVGMLPTFAFAADWTSAPAFEMNADLKGNIVTVTLGPKTDAGFTALEFDLLYDAEHLKVVGDEDEGTGIYEQTFGRNNFPTLTVGGGKIGYAAARNNNFSVTGGTAVFTADFEVADGFTGAISFTLGKLKAGTYDDAASKIYDASEYPSAAIKGAAPTTLTASETQTLFSGGGTATFDLSKIISGMPQDAGAVTYAAANGKYGTASVKGSTLTYEATAQAAGTTDSVVVTVSSELYEDAAVTVNFEYKSKTDVSAKLAMEPITVTYGESYAPAATYDGKASDKITYTYEDSTGAALAAAPANAGTYTVVATYEDDEEEGGIRGHIGTVSAALTINRASAAVSGVQDLSKKFNGETVSVPTCTYAGDGQLIVKWYDAQEAELDAAPMNVGTYKVGVAAAEGVNYEAAAEVRQAFEITKADAPSVAAAAVQTLLSSDVKSEAYSRTFDLSSILTNVPANAGTVTYEATDGTYGTSSVTGSVLTYSVTTPQAKDTTDSVLVTLHFDNYADATAAVNFKFESKTDVTDKLALADITVTYGESYTVAATYDGKASDNFTYTFTNDQQESFGFLPQDAGVYTVAAAYEDDVEEGGIPGHIGTVNATITINRAAAAVKDVEDVSKTYDGEPAAEPKYTYNGDGKVTVKWYDAAGEELPQAPADAGSYKVGISAAEGMNFAAAEEVKKDVTIAKKAIKAHLAVYGKSYDAKPADVTAEWEVKVTYVIDGGAEQELAGETPAFLWKTANEEAPTAPGTYTLTAKAAEDSNYTYEATAQYTIMKAYRYLRTETDTFTVKVGDKLEFAPEFDQQFGAGEIQYLIADKTVVNLVGEQYEALKVGSTKVVAELKATELYEADALTFTVGVLPAELDEVKPAEVAAEVDTGAFEGDAKTIAEAVAGNANAGIDEDATAAAMSQITALAETADVETLKSEHAAELADLTGQQVVAKVETKMELKAVSADDPTARKLTFDITMKAILAVTGTDGGSNEQTVVLAETPITTLDRPVYLTIPLPENFIAAYVNHTHDGKTKVITGSMDLLNWTFTIRTDGFSDFEVVEDGRQGTIRFLDADGFVLEDKTYTAADAASGTALPTPAMLPGFVVPSGKTFKGWKICRTGSEARTLDTKMTEELLDYIAGGLDIAAEPVFANRTTSGGGGGTATYAVNVAQSENGTVTVGTKSTYDGMNVSVQAVPNAGYVVESVKVVDAKGNEVKVTGSGSAYSFVMPASSVTVTAVFADGEQIFSDVPNGEYYAAPVRWAVKMGITSGTSATTFAPNAECSRAQMVTFLWRAAGSPETEVSESFFDVADEAYYAQAVAWAQNNGITNGKGKGHFEPDSIVTRAEAITFLYRFAKAANATGGNPFTDVAANAFYYNPVLWAVANGITNGTSATAFAPDVACNRGQIVTFLYRLLAEK